MQPDFMRRVDYWLGIPACFLLTLICRIQTFLGFGGSDRRAAPENILLIELIEMGTLVVAYPAIRALRIRYPNATIHFLCFEQIRGSVAILGAIDQQNIISIDSGSLVSLARDTLKFAWLSRRRKIDTVINLEAFVRYSTMLSYLSGARNRVGYHRFNQEGIYTGELLTHKVSFNPHIHTAHTFLDLVHALDAPADEIPRIKRRVRNDDLSIPRRTTSRVEEDELWSMLAALNPEIDRGKRLVVVNPNASKLFGMRKLPLERYAELVRKLVADEDLYVLIIGVEAEKADASYICQRADSRQVIDLTGKTTLPQLLDLFNLADVLVTNDSGPAHFAALTNIHIVVFFGPELPERYRPLSDRCDVVYTRYSCSPCVSPFNQRLTACNNNRCMKSIDIDDVYDLVVRRSREAAPGRRALPKTAHSADADSVFAMTRRD